MSMAGRNLMKAIAGTVVGLGIGAAVSTAMSWASQPPEERQSLSESMQSWREIPAAVLE